MDAIPFTYYASREKMLPFLQQKYVDERIMSAEAVSDADEALIQYELLTNIRGNDLSTEPPEVLRMLYEDDEIPDAALEWVTMNVFNEFVIWPEDKSRVLEVFDWWSDNRKDGKTQKSFKKVYPAKNFKNPLEWTIHQIEEVYDEHNQVDLSLQKLEKFKPEVLKLPDAKTYGSIVGPDGDKWDVIEVKGAEAACYYGDSTRWCTRHPGTASSYLRDGPLYVVYQDGQKVHQAHLSEHGSWMYMDTKDYSVEMPNAVAPIFVRIMKERDRFPTMMDSEYPLISDTGPNRSTYNPLLDKLRDALSVKAFLSVPEVQADLNAFFDYAMDIEGKADNAVSRKPPEAVGLFLTVGHMIANQKHNGVDLDTFYTPMQRASWLDDAARFLFENDYLDSGQTMMKGARFIKYGDRNDRLQIGHHTLHSSYIADFLLNLKLQGLGDVDKYLKDYLIKNKDELWSNAYNQSDWWKMDMDEREKSENRLRTNLAYVEIALFEDARWSGGIEWIVDIFDSFAKTTWIPPTVRQELLVELSRNHYRREGNDDKMLPLYSKYKDKGHVSPSVIRSNMLATILPASLDVVYDDYSFILEKGVDWDLESDNHRLSESFKQLESKSLSVLYYTDEPQRRRETISLDQDNYKYNFANSIPAPVVIWENIKVDGIFDMTSDLSKKMSDYGDMLMDNGYYAAASQYWFNMKPVMPKEGFWKNDSLGWQQKLQANIGSATLHEQIMAMSTLFPLESASRTYKEINIRQPLKSSPPDIDTDIVAADVWQIEKSSKWKSFERNNSFNLNSFNTTMVDVLKRYTNYWNKNFGKDGLYTEYVLSNQAHEDAWKEEWMPILRRVESGEPGFSGILKRSVIIEGITASNPSYVVNTDIPKDDGLAWSMSELLEDDVYGDLTEDNVENWQGDTGLYKRILLMQKGIEEYPSMTSGGERNFLKEMLNTNYTIKRMYGEGIYMVDHRSKGGSKILKPFISWIKNSRKMFEGHREHQVFKLSQAYYTLQQSLRSTRDSEVMTTIKNRYLQAMHPSNSWTREKDPTTYLDMMSTEFSTGGQYALPFPCKLLKEMEYCDTRNPDRTVCQMYQEFCPEDELDLIDFNEGTMSPRMRRQLEIGRGRANI